MRQLEADAGSLAPGGVEVPLDPLPPSFPRMVRGRHRDRDYALRRVLLVADWIGIWLALVLAMSVAGDRPRPLLESLWVLPALPLLALVFWAYELYVRPIKRFEPTHLEDVPALFHALVIGALGLWLYFKLVPPVPRLKFSEVLTFGLIALPLIAMLRATLRRRNLRLRGPERVFALAPLEDVQVLRRKFEFHPEYEMELVGSVEAEQAEELLASGQVDHLIVRLDARYLPPERMNELMQACHRGGVRFSCLPAARGLLFRGVELNHVEGVGLLTSNPPVLSRSAKLAKRSLDVGLSALLLALAAPLLAAIALAIWLERSGPVFYRQVRVGRDGRRFTMLKFRTMVPGSDRFDEELMEHSNDPDWLVMETDPRVTRLGRLLRRSSVDELPQLWHVLRGEMSMVGPRPLSERDDRKVEGWQRNRLDLTPGITGYWQVLGRNNMPFQEMLQVDYAYVAGWSLWQDVKLLLQTVPAVLRRRGAN